MIDFERLIGALADASTEFIVVGGFAATAHGATRLTQDLDLLGEITGGGRYEDLERHTVAIEVFDRRVLCLDLETLIRVKRAAGRPKDWDALGELEALHRERD